MSGTSGDGGEGGAQRRLVFTAPAPPPPEFDEFTDAYLPLQEGGGVCGMAGFGGTDDCRLRLSTDPEPPSPDSEDPGDPNDPNAQPVTYITITPYQAALMAAAYLPLQPGQPTVGPPPSINKWKTAAVGYPLWIWADGDLDPAPVSRSVSGLSVTLDADLAKIVYDMGDGTIITCGTGTPWRKGNVPAGTPSPDCGHTYTKPSLPEGDYTITATTQWAVAWTAGGQSGTIPFTQTSSTTLPVGEIQTLVR
ncbi:MAG: hypothetical protein L0H41_10210 [Microlunatus sp.]|nr:hypothetical protein [Microlunatus sp.]